MIEGWRFGLVAGTAVLLGCTSGTESGGGTGTSGGGGGTCAAKTASLRGSVDGMAVDMTYESNGYAFVVKSFSGTIGKGGRVEIVLQGTGASSTGSAIASAKLTMPSEGPLAGKVFCATGGELTSGSVYTFTLTGLQAGEASADAGACSGTPVSGTLSGCVGGAR